MIFFVDRINDIRKDIFECRDVKLLRKVAVLLHAIADVTETQADLLEEQYNELRQLRQNRKKVAKN